MSPQTPLDFDALDPSGSIDEPPSYGVLLLTEDGILVYQEDFLANVTPSSNWQAQLAKHPDLAKGWQMLVSIMLLEKG